MANFVAESKAVAALTLSEEDLHERYGKRGFLDAAELREVAAYNLLGSWETLLAYKRKQPLTSSKVLRGLSKCVSKDQIKSVGPLLDRLMIPGGPYDECDGSLSSRIHRPFDL